MLKLTRVKGILNYIKAVLVQYLKDGVRVFFRKIQQFMYGRYGSDKLNFVLLIAGIVVSLIGQFTGFFPLVIVSYAFYVYAIYRMLSKNITARQKEYYSFLKVWTPITKWFKMRKTIFDNRKTYRYFKCPNCKQWLRAPKGKGKIQVTCQKCRKEFVKKV